MASHWIQDTSADDPILELDEAIASIEADACPDGVQVDLGGGLIARADGPMGLGGLLQRLRAHKVLMALARMPSGSSATPMRTFSADMHPDVAIILDALRNKD